ncbi:MAG: protease pro-enzyme activation domain-containing protein [Acidimicrobiales bacterium]|jgi:hypothetical protein
MFTVTAAPELPLGASALGAVRTGSTQSGIVVLRPSNESALAGFIAAVTNKNSRLFHQYLAPGAFAQRFGPSRATIKAVEGQLRADGLRVTGVTRDGLFVSFEGSAATVETAFRTGLERYRLANGTIGQGTTASLKLPSTIAGSVAAVVGLDDLVHAQPADIRPSAASPGTFPKATSASFTHPTGSADPCTLAQQDAEGSGGLTDDAIANSYGAFGLYRSGDFAGGQHIAVFELQPFLPTDIETFDTCYFGATEAAQMSGVGGVLTGSLLSIQSVDGGLPQPASDSSNVESTLDVEDVSAIAPQANIDVYEAPNTTSGAIDEYAAIVNSDIDQVVTSSWGDCEQLEQVGEPGYQQAENLLFEQAAAQGQTVLAAAGDNGSDECTMSGYPSPLLSQNFVSVLDPGSQPYVVSVGGTTIDDATEPPSEHVWNDGALYGAGGGGISESWAMPSWQETVADTANNAADMANAEAEETATALDSAPYTTPTFCDGTLGIPSGSLCRETPDVSAQADEFTGAVTIYGQSLGYGSPDGWATVGGTSSATPIWAALLALVNASSACSADLVNGVPDAGFASPILYGIAASPTAYAASFNDVVSGDNDQYGLDSGLLFPARAGYDMASGLGSPQLTTPAGSNGLAFYMCDYGEQLKPPSVTGLDPVFGSTTGGYSVTVSGSGFGTAGSPKVGSVEVGSAQASSFTVTNDTTLTATFPAGASALPPDSLSPQDGAGPADVVVTLTDGESSFPDAASEFEYVDENATPSLVPSVSSVGPYGGLETSPAPVTIYGSGFSDATGVSFGGVAASSFTIESAYEIVVTPPVYSTAMTCAPLPTTGAYVGEDATNDICQVEVVVSNHNGSSATSTILPPYEGALTFDPMGAEIVPSGFEATPQPTEFDYVPAPQITSVSTGTIADLSNCVTLPADCNAALLASETGGLVGNLVTINGVGMNDLTLDYAAYGEPVTEDSMAQPVAATGTSLELAVPAMAMFGVTTIEPITLPVSFTSMAGTSNESNIVYAGVPEVTSVVNTVTGLSGVPDSVACTSPPPASGCGTPITISGVGLLQTVGPIEFADNVTGYSLGTQYHFTLGSDTSLATDSVQQNPGLMDVEVCTVSGCSYNPPMDELYVYPPGNPTLENVEPAAGPAHGGNQVTLNGSNLGCVIAVYFGDVQAYSATNSEALLTCGTTNQVVAQVPPGPAGKKVKITVQTVESIFSPTGKTSNSVEYTYRDSVPSAPVVTATALTGKALVTWTAPAADGGSPITSYTVRASSPGRLGVGESFKPSQRSAVFSDLQAGAPWTFTVKAISKLGLGLPGVSNAVTPVLGDDGYLIEAPDGATFGFGDIDAHGGIAGEGMHPAGLAMAPQGLGYWLVTTTGAVFPFGEATMYGDLPLRNVTGIAAMPNGAGYWVVAGNGSVRAFGQARDHRGTLRRGVDYVGIASSASGLGYWLVASDGAVSHFGDAGSFGSMYGKALDKPIVGMAVTPDGQGYWLVAADGGVFCFGDAHFYGSLGGKSLARPIVGIAAAPNGKGYWLVGSNGRVYSFGLAENLGSGPRAAAIGA